MLLVYGGLFVLFLIQPNTKQQITNKKVFCILAGIFLFLIAASRNLNYGDVLDYKSTYATLPYISFEKLFSDWLSDDLKDFGFYAVSKVFADLGINADGWVLSIAFVFAVFCAVYLYKFSEQPYIGLLVMLSLFYGFTFTGLRQTVALAICFLSYQFISEKKLMPFIISVLVAALFHSSAIIMLPAYFIAKLKIGLKQPIMVGISVIVSVFFPSVFRNLITRLAWNDYLLEYSDREETLSWAGFIIQLAIWAFCLYFRRSIKEDNKYMRAFIDALINCLTIGLCLQSFAPVVAESFRLSYYYSMCAIAIVPNVIEKQTEIKNRAILQFIVPVLFVLNMLRDSMYFNIGLF